jgi:hypothetical protein
VQNFNLAIRQEQTTWEINVSIGVILKLILKSLQLRMDPVFLQLKIGPSNEYFQKSNKFLVITKVSGFARVNQLSASKELNCFRDLVG